MERMIISIQKLGNMRKNVINFGKKINHVIKRGLEKYGSVRINAADSFM